jgi:diaminopimelate epimerase
MIELPFIKMHGCGNDYVFIDAMEWNPSRLQSFDFSAISRRISDRHRSVGGDGLVLMYVSERSDADARMRMFNADGSEGVLCGNALRCMAMWLHISGHCGPQCRIAMHDRIIETEVVSCDPERKQANVRVAIGSPVVLSPGVTGLSRFVRQITLSDVVLYREPLQVAAVSMGNPHAIVLIDDVKSLAIETIGPQIEHHPEFSDRTNVEFVQITAEDTATVRVWERGSGETQACGSGGCAVAVMGWAFGFFSPKNSVRIRMPGGDLTVQISDDETVFLEGAAEESYRGYCLVHTRN